MIEKINVIIYLTIKFITFKVMKLKIKNDHNPSQKNKCGHLSDNKIHHFQSHEVKK